MTYRCKSQRPCKYLQIDFDVFEAMGETRISNDQWYCMKRDDEKCIPNCKEYKPTGWNKAMRNE